MEVAAALAWQRAAGITSQLLLCSQEYETISWLRSLDEMREIGFHFLPSVCIRLLFKFCWQYLAAFPLCWVLWEDWLSFFLKSLLEQDELDHWMLKDLDYGINLTLAEANISRQKSSILVLCKERRREEVLYRCRCSQTQHEHNIMEKQHQVDTEPPLIKTQATHYWESCTQWLLPRKNKKSNSEYSVA